MSMLEIITKKKLGQELTKAEIIEFTRGAADGSIPDYLLCVTELNTIVIHAHVIGTHRADIDGFDTAHTTIVFNLYTREIADGICHA